LNGTVAPACHAHNLAKIELLVRVAIKQPQNRPTVPAKESLRKWLCWKGCTHI
jgi:hypothetical protein